LTGLFPRRPTARPAYRRDGHGLPVAVPCPPVSPAWQHRPPSPRLRPCPRHRCQQYQGLAASADWWHQACDKEQTGSRASRAHGGKW